MKKHIGIYGRDYALCGIVIPLDHKSGPQDETCQTCKQNAKILLGFGNKLALLKLKKRMEKWKEKR
jgi:hypothetical protein